MTTSSAFRLILPGENELADSATQIVQEQLRSIRDFISEWRTIRVNVSEIDRARKLDALTAHWSHFGPISRGVWEHIRETLTGGADFLMTVRSSMHHRTEAQLARHFMTALYFRGVNISFGESFGEKCRRDAKRTPYMIDYTFLIAVLITIPAYITPS